MGATYDRYELGIDIPPGFKRFDAPSKHSGESSLSPQEPVKSQVKVKSIPFSQTINQVHIHLPHE